MEAPATMVTAAWWGYAAGNKTLVGIIVAVLVVLALGYLGRRWWLARRGG